MVVLFSGGRIEKSAKGPRPLPKAIVTANKEARKALATGEIASNEIQLKKAKDLRTLYIRFKVSKGPTIQMNAITVSL